MGEPPPINPGSLGRLAPVELRDVWRSEAADFTPWLANQGNLDLLGEAIGLDLELEACEATVGCFRADLVCRDTSTTDARVLIENQLERTDHGHLGQLMTYAAGLATVTIVWIAERFTDEHRAAIDWLNEVTREGINFFGLEIELWRIGDSTVAPKFNVVCQPNDWLKSGPKAQVGLSPARVTQLEFWTAFREFVGARDSTIRPTQARPQNWMPISIGRTGFRLYAVASTWNSEEGSYDSHELRAEFLMDGDNADLQFLTLQTEQQAIEREMGEQLAWHRPEDKHARKVFLRRNADLNSRTEWPAYHQWLLEKLERLRSVFAPRLRELPTSEGPVVGGQPPL